MNQKHLLRFIKHKLKHSPNEIVTIRDGKKLTLSEVFKSLHLTAYDLSIDTLDMHANNTFHRFDRFNLKYNPAGESRLREIFLKTDNLIEGRYLAEVTREMMSDLTDAKYTLVEWRLSIYGRRKEEWAKLASWFHRHHLAHKNVRWVIQIPRLYHVYKQAGDVSCFQDMMDLIFAPLFEVSVRPSSNPVLHAFLKTVVAFDSVDDESKVDHVNLHPERYLPTPTEWDLMDNPPYTYWTYYLWANMTALNRLRASKGLNTFEFRPHCGEAGSPQHLAACFLVADQINHGIMLRKTPALQYLYYMEQIGIAMSPLSNNRLFLDYSKNPFPRYHAIGMNVSLSTDDPLMLHYTKDPLVEEYSVAAQVWKMSSTDQCEIARNSVLQSGFEARFKRHFLGDSFDQPWAEGNDIRQTNVPNIRLRYRQETLFSEHSFVHSGGVEAQPGT
jgi:AMP deaminase